MGENVGTLFLIIGAVAILVALFILANTIGLSPEDLFKGVS